MRVASISLAFLALVSSAACGRGWTSEKPPIHLNPNMDTQMKGRGYRDSALVTDVFADHRMMRTPPSGTVARGFLHEDDHLSLGVVKNDKGELAASTKFPGGINPEDKARQVRGAERFQIYCAPCHGKDFQGKGPVGLKMQIPPPDLLQQRIKEMPDGKIYQAILNGVNNGNMPSYEAQVSEQDRWDIVIAIRAAQKEKDPGQPWEPEGVVVAVDMTKGPSAVIGEALYKTKGCNACHSVDGTRIVGPTFQGLYGKQETTDKGSVAVDDAYLKESILNPAAQIVAGYPPAMPPQVLTDDEIKSLTLFIASKK